MKSDLCYRCSYGLVTPAHCTARQGGIMNKTATEQVAAMAMRFVEDVCDKEPE